MWWAAIQSSKDFFVSHNTMSGDKQLMVLVQQFRKIKAGIPVIFLALPLEYNMAAAPVTITSLKAKKKKRQGKNKRKTEDARGEKEEWVVLMVCVVYATFIRKSKILPQAPIPSAGFYLYLIGQNYFSWPHRESDKVSLELFQFPEWLAERGWKCLLLYQGPAPATIEQSERKYRWWRN